MGRTLYKSAKEGIEWVLLQMFPRLTTKERSCHVYNDSMPSKQIIRQTIMYGATLHVTRLQNDSCDCIQNTGKISYY